jgi:hypothetical protein
MQKSRGLYSDFVLQSAHVARIIITLGGLSA